MLQRRPWSLPPPPPPKGIWLEGPKLRHALRRWQARISRVLVNTGEGRRPPEVDFRTAQPALSGTGNPREAVYTTRVLGPPADNRRRRWTAIECVLISPSRAPGCRGVPSRDKPSLQRAPNLARARVSPRTNPHSRGPRSGTGPSARLREISSRDIPSYRGLPSQLARR